MSDKLTFLHIAHAAGMGYYVIEAPCAAHGMVDWPAASETDMKKNLRPPTSALIATVLICGCGFVDAAQYYVSPTGNDGNPGTQAAPWASIGKGVDIYNPGDTLYLRGGTYALTSGIYFYRSGNAASPITIRSFPGETAVIDGAAIGNTNSLVYISANYFVMQDLEIKNSKQNGITVEGGTFVTLTNCTVHDSHDSGIYIGKNDLTSTHDILVQNCTVYNNCHMNDAHTLNGGWPGALVAGRASGVTVKDCTIYKNNGEGIIFFLADRCRATGNTSHDNYGPNIYIDNATNCVVERNMVYSTLDPAYFRGGSQTCGIQFANEPYNFQNPSNNITIINNVLVNNNYAFYYGSYGIGGGLKNFVFANNTIHTSRLESIHVDTDAHSNAVFSNNVCSQKVNGAQAVLPASLAGLSFSNNLWYGPGAGAASGTGDVTGDPKLVNPGSFLPNDYKVQSGSPIKGVGKVMAVVTDDFNAGTRSQPIDLGAFIAPAPPVNHAPVLTTPTCTPNPALTNQTMSFTASASDSDGDALVYTWNMGNGTTKTGAAVTQAYSAAGTYNVSVTVTDGKGGSDTKSISATVNVPVNTPPVLSAVPTCAPNPAIVNQVVSCTATATDANSDPLTYTWDMGNGATLTGASVSQIYTAAGVFTIRVTVSDGKGGSDTKTVSLTVNNPPVNHPPVLAAVPTSSPNPALVGQTMAFTASATDSDNDPITYTWDMGNGTTKTGASVALAYSAAGVYTVSVTVTDGKGGSDSKSISATVNVQAASQNHAPVLAAAPTCNPNPVIVGQTVSLLASATDSDSDPLVYTWNMGNGSVQTGASINYVYNAVGTYTAMVTVQDGKGGSDTKSVTITVNPVAVPVNHPPVLVAAPSCSPNPVNGGLAMNFSASATDPDNDPLTYTWNMGNGQTRTGAAFSQVYSTPGTYTVSVTVTDGRGGSDTKTVSAVVNPAAPTNSPPTITSVPTYSPNPGIAGQPVMFTIAAADPNNDPLTYTWDMGDGTTCVGSTVSKTYATDAQYNVIVRITDGKGGSIAVLVLATINKGSAPMTVSAVYLAFDTKTQHDSISVIGNVPLPIGFQLENANAIVTIGGFEHSATLTAKGLSTDRTLKLSTKTVRGLTAVSNVPVTMNVKRVPLQSLFSSYNLDMAKGVHQFPVTVNVVIGDKSYSGEATATYIVK